MMRIPYKQPSESPFKNHFMNGCFDFWQRGLSFTSFEGKIADRFSVGYATSPGRATWSRENAIVPPNGLTQYSLKAQTSIIDAAPAAGALGLLRHRIEGNYFRALRGKTFYLKGKIYTNITGNWTIGFSNATESNRWLDQINVPVANTWTDFILDVTHNPLNGSWNYNELSGLHVIVPVVAGTNHQTAASNKRNWSPSAGRVITGSANANFHSSLSNVMYLAQLQLVTDPDEVFQRMGGSFAEELHLCQRYLEKSYDIDVAPTTVTDVGAHFWQANQLGDSAESVYFAKQKRIAPIISAYNPVTGTLGSLRAGGSNATFQLFLSGQRQFSFREQDGTGEGPATFRGSMHWVAD